jgi:hypothetical protein
MFDAQRMFPNAKVEKGAIKKDGKSEFPEPKFNAEINQSITDAISEFEASEKNDVETVRLFKAIFKLKNDASLGMKDFNISWNAGQMEKMVDIFNDSYESETSPVNNRNLISRLFSSNSAPKGEKLASDYFADELAERVREGKSLNSQTEKEIQLWAQDIHTISEEARMALTLSLIRNPGVVNDRILGEIIDTHAFYGPAMVRNLERQFNEASDNISQTLGIIDIFESIAKRNGWGTDFEGAIAQALDVLERIKSQNKNYFVAERLELLSQFLQQGEILKTKDLMSKYADNNLAKVAPEPRGARFYSKPEEFTNECVTTKIDKKYGAVYNPQGEIDSFFLANGLLSNTLRLEEILEKEGPEIYGSMNEREKNFLVDNYKALLNVHFRDKIENEFGIKIEQLSIREQIQFVNFLAQKKIDEVAEIKTALNGPKSESVKTTCLKSFLSLEYDRSNGKKIIRMSEKLSAEDAEKVFRKIAELTDLAQEKNKELAEIIFKDGQKEIPVGIQTELLRKAHQIILKFSTEIETGGRASEEKIQKLLADLEKSRIDINIMASLLIAMKKAGEGQNVSEIRGVEMVSISGEELKKDRELELKLEEMYRASNSQKSKKDQERLLSDFERHKQYDPRFHLVYFDKENKTDPKKSLDNLVGFMRSSSFDGQRELPEGERYLGAMNIDPILQKFYFGENFLREIVEKEFSSGTKKLIAHVPENGPSHKIVKLLGFETVDEEGDYKDDDGKVIAKRIRVELVRS